VTVYILLIRLPFLRVANRSSGIRRRLVHTAQASLHDLFLGAVLLALGVHVASILGSGSNRDEATTMADKSAVRVGDRVLLLVTTFCYTPVLLLFVLLGHGYRRRWLRRIVISAVYLFWVTNQSLRIFTSDSWKFKLGFRPWNNVAELLGWNNQNGDLVGCTYEGLEGLKGAPFVLWICFFSLIALPALWAVYFAITSAIMLMGFGLQYGGKLRRPRSAIFEALVANATMFFSFLGMWVALGILLYVHTQTQGVPWDLGQILALGTWIPLFTEFVYMFLCKCFTKFKFGKRC
jgi:hypothetical protein